MVTKIKSTKVQSKQTSMNSIKKNKLIFYYSMVILPLLQFLIFYVYINFQSFVLGFQEYSFETGEYFFAGIKNFKQIFSDFQTLSYLQNSVTNSLTLFIWTFIFGAILSVFFSYYIYKKHIGSTLFKIMLYLPHILGGVVVVIIYKYFVEDAFPAIAQFFGFEGVRGLLTNLNTKRATIMFYTIYVSFGTQVLIYSSSMSGISESIIESAQLDGVTPLKELVFIVLPMIWNTFVTFMVSSVVGLFTNQMSLYTFYGDGAHYSLYTFGYYIFRGAKIATLAEYPYLSAMGLLLTVTAVPLTLFTRWVLKKYGPSRE